MAISNDSIQSYSKFLLTSVDFPSIGQKNEFIAKAGPHSSYASPFHKTLAASASLEQWKSVLKAIRENNVDHLSLLNDKSKLRPLKPNDDNYQAFTGEKWKPESITDKTPSIPSALSSLLSDDDNTQFPRYNHCANCTKRNVYMNQCSRCKMVKYCSRECQSLHWKKVHKESCTKAQPFSLYESMCGSDGFYISPEECRVLHRALSEESRYDSDEVIRCFWAYFGVASDLGGCFVL